MNVEGLVVESRDTLPCGAIVIARFYIPSDRQAIEAAGRVLRVEAGKSMVIGFLGLLEGHRRRIAEYVATQQTGKVVEFDGLESQDEHRRSGRLRRRLPVVVGWHGEEGFQKQQAGETLNLSENGAKVVLFTPLQPGQLLRIILPDSGREATARVVWARPEEAPGRVAVGLEFMGAQDFWGFEFPPAQRPEKATRRRGPRWEQHMGVMLSWVDEWGCPREASVETSLLSKHGAQLSSPVGLARGQRVRLRIPELNREAEAEVVWARSGETTGSTDMGIEFIGTDDFWNPSLASEPGRAN